MNIKHARGKIIRLYEISCGCCGDTYFLTYESCATNVALQRNWRYTKAHGWECPDCRKAQKEEVYARTADLR